MKSIKYLVVLACMTLGLANIAKAQIYSNEVCYYKNTANEKLVLVVKFDGLNDRVLIMQKSPQVIERRLKESIDFFEDDEEWSIGVKNKESKGTSNALYKRSESFYFYEYDNQLSTSKREVYKRRFFCTECAPNQYGYVHFGFSMDKQTIIQWTTLSDNKNYYIRVSKEDLLPKNVVPDFLNE